MPFSSYDGKHPALVEASELIKNSYCFVPWPVGNTCIQSLSIGGVMSWNGRWTELITCSNRVNFFCAKHLRLGLDTGQKVREKPLTCLFAFRHKHRKSQAQCLPNVQCLLWFSQEVHAIPQEPWNHENQRTATRTMEQAREPVWFLSKVFCGFTVKQCIFKKF